MTKTARLAQAAIGAGLALAVWGVAPAHAEFLNDVKRTFQTDVPHFFQDDIPCAFGGQPTSGAKSNCKSKPGDPASMQLHGEAVPGGRPAPVAQTPTQPGRAQAGPTQASTPPVQGRPIPY